MDHCYFESRRAPLNQTTELTADLMRHLHARQYLGKALIIHASPIPALRVARKQWLRLARLTQKNRASTVNADKILRFTYAITHMQHMQFTAKSPLHNPEAHVYFIGPRAITVVPQSCYTVYVCAPLSTVDYASLRRQLPQGSLIVDYTGELNRFTPKLPHKTELEAMAEAKWHEVQKFCHQHQVNLTNITRNQLTQIEAMDNALDTLLGVSRDFLELASAFQHALELAKPCHIAKSTQEHYNTLTVLAYRVQALTPGSLPHAYMLRTYHEDETFFLHDITLDMGLETEGIAGAVARHQRAGRDNLASALLGSAEQLSLARLQLKHLSAR